MILKTFSPTDSFFRREPTFTVRVYTAAPAFKISAEARAFMRSLKKKKIEPLNEEPLLQFNRNGIFFHVRVIANAENEKALESLGFKKTYTK